MFDKVNSTYEHALAVTYHKIDKRGIYVDVLRLEQLKLEVVEELKNLCTVLTKSWGLFVYVGNIKPDITTILPSYVNINSSSGENSLINTLKKLGYKIPAVRKKNKDKEFEMKESADELALQKMFAETGDINLKHLMRIKELGKLLGTYINVRLHKNVLYSSYGVASTVTGRRGCSKSVFGFGANAQTIPSHTLDRFTHEYRKCLIARRGHVLFSVDQKSAEDWPVCSLAGNTSGLQELAATTWPENDRHTKLAAFVFGVPVSQYSKKEWKDTGTQAGMMRYAGGKKARHASNYGMRANRFSQVLAKEAGISMSEAACKDILDKVDQYDPSTKLIFHKYIQDQLNTFRTLVTPLGRERQFFGLRPNSPNWEVLNEAYSYIPQSTVGDNTGLAVLYLDCVSNLPFVIQEGHDSIIQEVPDNIDSLEHVMLETGKSFKRILRFYNGIEVEIPIEAELSYDFENKIALKDYTIDSLRETYRELREKHSECPVNAVIG
jgi:hypothetical protein